MSLRKMTSSEALPHSKLQRLVLRQIRAASTRGSSRMLNRVVLALIMVLIFPLLFVSASDPGTTDWPMWGGTPDRNMVSNAKGLPASWDTATKKNVKWVAALGSQTYGNPVVAGGMVFVGTNNEGLRNPKEGGDRGVLMAFRESDGE
ncbi:MAG: hypothetical protein DMG06_30260, partial [Acidobacteria bacterium]